MRAVLNGDQEGAHALVGNTRCQGCLAIQAATLGLILKVEYIDSVDVGADGHLVFTGDECDDLDAALAEMPVPR